MPHKKRKQQNHLDFVACYDSRPGNERGRLILQPDPTRGQCFRMCGVSATVVGLVLRSVFPGGRRN